MEWSTEEIDFLRQCHKFMTYEEISFNLKRTRSSIQNKIIQLKLVKKNNPVKIGERYGRLIIIDKSTKRNKKNQIYNICLCDCGKQTEVIGTDLKKIKHATVSCGCYRFEMRRNRRLIEGEVSYNELERRSQIGAKKRNLQYSLSKEEFRNLIKRKLFLV
jgi:hypothetical protein